MLAIVIALGGGALLLAAVMHLAAPVIVIRSVVAVETPFARPHGSNAPKRVVARNSRPAPRIARNSIHVTTLAHPIFHTANATSPTRAAPTRTIATQTIATQTIATHMQPHVAPPRRAIVEPRVIRVANRQHSPSFAHVKFASTLARPRHPRVGKSAPRRSARVAPTPEPPVGFDERPTLVEAPIARQATSSMSASDVGLSGLRIRGRLLATPAPETAAKVSP